MHKSNWKLYEKLPKSKNEFPSCGMVLTSLTKLI